MALFVLAVNDCMHTKAWWLWLEKLRSRTDDSVRSGEKDAWWQWFSSDTGYGLDPVLERSHVKERNNFVKKDGTSKKVLPSVDLDAPVWAMW